MHAGNASTGAVQVQSVKLEAQLLSSLLVSCKLQHHQANTGQDRIILLERLAQAYLAAQLYLPG